LYRLAVFPIRLPPLRDRGADVDRLAEHFLGELNRSEQTEKRFTRGALELLRGHLWPGNVRELKNVVERSYILADQDIDQDCISSLESQASPTAPSEEAGNSAGPTIEIALGASIEEAERRLILATLEACDGNKEKAAGTLKISLKTLYNRLHAYRYTRPGKDSKGNERAHG
jgi:DNA-binding NtrC family response regulator